MLPADYYSWTKNNSVTPPPPWEDDRVGGRGRGRQAVTERQTKWSSSFFFAELVACQVRLRQLIRIIMIIIRI